MPIVRGQYAPTDETLDKYGITREHYDDLFETQGGVCAICLHHPIQAIDHCHESDQFRGLLCIRCNAGLGLFADEQATLSRAIDYLRKADLVEHDDEDMLSDPAVPRQPDGWIKGSPWALFGYTVTFDQDEDGAWVQVSRGGETVGEIGILVPPRPRAQAEIWVRRKWINELPVRDTGTFD